MNKLFEHQKAIQFEKKLTEVYLGYSMVYWRYAIANYSASLIEAVDFTLFDKTICGLLAIEEVLSLEDIGTILGFNVVDDLGKRQYLDIAEYELLEDALQELYEFGMVDIGDLEYTACSLTKTGRQYAALKKKFKTIENGAFKLYFDKITGNHTLAKQLFGEYEHLSESLAAAEVMLQELPDTIKYEDEIFLKEFAHHQIPEIYDPVKMHSFKDLALEDLNDYCLPIEVVLLLDVTTGTFRTVACVNGVIHSYFTTYLMEHKAFQQSTQQNLRVSLTQEKRAANLSFPAEAIKRRLDFDHQVVQELAENPKEALAVQDTFFQQAQLLEYPLFLQHLASIFQHQKGELWIEVETLSVPIVEALENFIQKNEQAECSLFLVFNTEIKEDEILQGFKQQVINSKNAYLLFHDTTEDFLVITTKESAYYAMETYDVSVKVGTEIMFHSLDFVTKRIGSQEELEAYLVEKRVLFAEQSVSDTMEKMYKALEEIDRQVVQPIAFLDESAALDYKLQVFKSCKTVETKIKQLEVLKNECLSACWAYRAEQFQVELELLKAQIEAENTLKSFKHLESSLKQLQAKAAPKEQYLFDPIEQSLLKKQLIAKALVERPTFVVDTNILIQIPHLITEIGQHANLVFSGKVIDELDKLKHKKTTKSAAVLAIQNIQKNKSTPNVQFRLASTKLLPEDFDARSPDNKILSVALLVQRKYSNTVLLSNDQAMHIKARMLQLKCLSSKELGEFLSQTLQKDKLPKRISSND